MESKDPHQQDAYFSALVCHYWFYLKIFVRKNKGSDIPVEECYNWLIEGIQRALGARWGQRWRDPTNKLYRDPNAVDKSIKRCLGSVRAGYYQDANRIKRKANYVTDSLEQYCDEFGDYYFNLIEGGAEASFPDPCHSMIQDTFEQGSFIKGAILDEICYQDCFSNGSLNKRKAVKDLRSPNKNYEDYLCLTYNLAPERVKAGCEMLRNFSSPRMHRWIDRLLSSYREEPELVDLICY